MKQEKLDRINFLARKSRSEALSAEELAEQKALRAEYIAEYREILRSQLDNMYVLDKDGNEVKLKDKSRGMPQ